MDIFLDENGVAFSFLNYKDENGIWHWTVTKDTTIRGESKTEYQSIVDAMAALGIDNYNITRRNNG